MNKGFNYSQDAPGIAYSYSANPPSKPLRSTKRQLFCLELGDAARGDALQRLARMPLLAGLCVGALPRE